MIVEDPIDSKRHTRAETWENRRFLCWRRTVYSATSATS
jgi:hypothetical protein